MHENTNTNTENTNTNTENKGENMKENTENMNTENTRYVDQGAVLKDDRPTRQIFEEGMVQGLFNTCTNANQVNTKIAEMQGKAVCTYFVNSRSHGWKYEGGKWVAPNPEWVKANQFVPGQKLGSLSARKGLLSDTEIEAIKNQISGLELVPEAGKAAIQPIVDGLYDQLASHRKACELASMTRELAKNRTSAKQSLEYVLRILDGTGIDWKNDYISWAQEVLSGYDIDQSRIDIALMPVTDSEPDSEPETK